MRDDLVSRLRRAVTWQGVVPHGNGLAREAADEIERLREEIAIGDYWHTRAIQAIEDGTCPICFSGDESGHKNGCLWGEVEDRNVRLEAEIERLRKEHQQDQIKQSREFESQIGNYPLKSIQQKDSEIERLKKAIEDANLAGFKEGFNSAENQLAELKAENERWRIICEEQAARIARSAEKFRHLKTIIESDD
jgi:hypothetical protein